MKYIVTLFCSLLIAGQAWSQKITNLTANTTPADADLTVVVDDVAGTPTTQKITLATLKTYFQTGLEGDLSDSAGLAAAISDETGTGVVVFSTSPTLVTPVLGAATATDLTLTGQSIYMNSGQTVSIKAGTGSPEGAVTAGIGSLWLATDGTTNTTVWRKESGTGNTGWVAVSAAGSVEGTAVLSTGEVGGTKFLREDGDGTSSWQTISGGGDALVANPLSQFAATTSSQLAGVISDETGSGAAVFATSPTLVTPALGTIASGVGTALTALNGENIQDDTIDDDSIDFTDVTLDDFSGTIIGAGHRYSAAAMGALAIDVTEMKNTKSISGAATMTFSATPSTGQIFGATVKNTAITDSVLTIPSSYSEAYNGARTTVTIPASGQVTLTWWYDGSQYNLYGDPVDFFDDIAEDLTPTDTNVDSVAYYDAATNAVKRIPIDDFIALNISSGNFGAAVFEIPNGTSGTTDATGEIYLDTDGDGGTNFSGPVVQIYDGSANKYLFPVALPLAASQNDYILKYDSTGKTVQWEADSGAGGGIANVVEDTTPTLGGELDGGAFDIVNLNSLILNEQASEDTPGAGKGRFWVINSTPSRPRFTDDAGSGFNILHSGTSAAQDEIVIGGSGGSGFVTRSLSKFSTAGTLTIPSGQGIELGHASENTLTAASGVLSVEGVAVPTISSTSTLTNKTIATGSNTIQLATEVFTAGDTLTAAEGYGKVCYVQGAYTIVLPAVATGMSITIIADAASVVTVDPSGSESIRLGATTLTGGWRIQSTGAVDEVVTLTYHSAGVWKAMTDAFVSSGS